MLQATIEQLIPVSLLSSERWFSYYSQKAETFGGSDAKKDVVRRAACALQDCQISAQFSFRQDDCERAFRDYDFEDSSSIVLKCLQRMKNDFLYWKGNAFVVKPDKLVCWATFISRVDPIWVLAYGYAEMLSKGLFSEDQMISGEHNQNGYALSHELTKSYADNHLHLGGNGDSSHAMLSFVFKKFSCGHKAEWPSMPEYPAYESGATPKEDIPFQFRQSSDLLLSFIFNVQTRSCEAPVAFRQRVVTNGLSEYVNLCVASNTAQKIIKASLQSSKSSSYRWLLFATGLIHYHLVPANAYAIESNVEKLRTLQGDSLSLFNAFVQIANIFRSTMIVNGVGLSKFVKTFGFEHRKGVVKTGYIKHAQLSDSENNIYKDIKISPDKVEEGWLKKEAEYLLSIKRTDKVHYSIHFHRDYSDPIFRNDKLQSKKRNKLSSERYRLQRLLKSLSLQNYKIKDAKKGSSFLVNLYRLVRGIDVAGNENDAPIEIFAPTIRALRGRRSVIPIGFFQHEKKMHLSIHAGEDYSHIWSGMRSIDETILFCGYQPGDRIGHGLALGVDAHAWAKMQQVAYLSVGEHLDNLVWAHHMVQHLPVLTPPLDVAVDAIARKIAKWSCKIWGKNVSPEILYRAWMLRRNCPLVALRKRVQSSIIPHEQGLLIPDFAQGKQPADAELELWREYTFNGESCSATKEKRKVVSVLLQEQKCSSFHEEEEWQEQMSLAELELVTAIQDMLIQRYSEIGVLFEACPTSNVYTARLNSYAEHPLFRWYPPDSRLLEPGQQFNKYGLRFGPLSVCLNTDDAGLMPTTIENEHKVMRDTAIRQYNISSEVAEQWIDRIRQIGMDIFHTSHIPLEKKLICS